MSEELLPCPFCGRSNIEEKQKLAAHPWDWSGFTVQCQGCWCTVYGDDSKSQESARSKWNTRTKDAVTDDLVAPSMCGGRAGCDCRKDVEALQADLRVVAEQVGYLIDGCLSLGSGALSADARGARSGRRNA